MLKGDQNGAREMVKNGKAILFGKDVLWIRLDEGTIKVCSWDRELRGFTNCYISNEEPEKLDFWFKEYQNQQEVFRNE